MYFPGCKEKKLDSITLDKHVLEVHSKHEVSRIQEHSYHFFLLSFSWIFKLSLDGVYNRGVGAKFIPGTGFLSKT